MSAIILIRHGDYEYTDPMPETLGQGLTARGVRQARATAKWLAHRGYEIDAILSSDYRRARQTADILAEALQGHSVRTCEHLRECIDVYYKDRSRVPPSATNAYSELFGSATSRSGTTIAVCHANLIRYLLSRLLRWSRESWEGTSIANCSLSIIEVGDMPKQVPQVLAVGSQAHLPLRLRETF